MGRVSQRDRDLLTQLVLDCDTSNIHGTEALEYIKVRLGREISDRTYRRYKIKLKEGNPSQHWINHYTKIGFLIHHHQTYQMARNLLGSILRQLYEEEQRPIEEKKYDRIIKFHQEARESIRLANELAYGTPIIARIKKQLQDMETKLEGQT
jgi:hypothetical protein